MPFLDWVNKAQAQRVAAHVSYHLLQFQSAHGDASAENLLIQGDNLLVLKALLPFYRGRVKCIYIDPPYNTQSAFGEFYDDRLEPALRVEHAADQEFDEGSAGPKWYGHEEKGNPFREQQTNVGGASTLRGMASQCANAESVRSARVFLRAKNAPTERRENFS